MKTPAAILLSRIDPSHLPTIPRVLLDLMNAVQRPDISMPELTKIIGQDASLSANVLSAANSSFYRQFGEITDLNRVIVVLGLNTIKTIAITRAVQQFFNSLPQTQQNMLELIWYRSLNCAHLARNLAELTAYEFPDEAYLAGLIHRLGQLILLVCFPKDYPEFLTEHLDGPHSQEKELFGVFHNEVAAHLIDSWKLQSFMSDAVLYQHHPIESITDSARLVKIVHLASQLSTVNSANKAVILVQAGELFGLNQPLLEDMITGVKPLVERSAGSLGISIACSEKSGIKNQTTPVQRQAVQNLLGDQIKDFALSAAVNQHLQTASEINKIAAIIQRDMQLLFGFQQAAVFLYNADSDSLNGLSAGDHQQDSLWPTLSIRCKSNQSLLTQALLQKQLKDSFNVTEDSAVNLADRQICRLLGLEGILVIPLYTEQKSVGIVVAGLNQSTFERLKPRTDFITLFAKEVASALLTPQSTPAQTLQLVANLRTDYELHAKKLAHEISNPLSIINNYLYLLGQRLGEDNAEEIKLIQEEIDRVGHILVRLPNAPDDISNDDHGLVDVNGVLVDLVKLLQVGLFKSHDINVSLKLDYTLPEISNNRNTLKQILINLFKNALEAMPTGGNITVTTLDKIYQGKNCYVEIQVQDNGPGLPDEIIQQLFIPVSSTKGKKHEGLGLTIAKNLTEELGGVLSCSSASGKGTTLKIFLPRTTVSQK